MDEGFSCEAVGSLVVVRLTQPMSERVLEECQLCMLETMQQTGSKAVLYDLTVIEADVGQRAALPAPSE